jgi:Flp pilus assembly protein TadG
MRMSSGPKLCRSWAQQSAIRFLTRHNDGTSAIEFAIVAVPFFMFVFGLMGVASYFFIMTSIDKGMEQNSRLIRTGQAQTADMTVNEFKQAVCNKAGSWVKCNKLQIFVQKFADWNKLAQYAGEANDIVLVTACYRWEFASKVPFFQMGQMSDGSLMMQSTTAFRTEPYSAN